MGDQPARINDVLKELGGRMGIKAPAETAALWSRWNDIVGESVAKHASPSSLREGILRVRAESPTWATEIGYLGGEIKQRINEALGTEVVREIRVWVGSKKDRTNASTTGSDGRPERAPVRPRAAPDADPLEAFERARGAWLKRTRGVRSQGRSEGAG